MERGPRVSAELASASELLALHTMATHWLAEHGEDFVEPADANNVNTYDGLPVTGEYPRIEAAVPGDVLRTVLPEAADILGVEDEFGIAYFYPHYDQVFFSGALIYRAPTTSFYTSSDEHITIQSKTFDLKYKPGLGACTGTKELRELGERAGRITRDECWALISIVGQLDDLVR